MNINLEHKEMTDEECYQNIKEMHKLCPNEVMDPEEWKKQRLEWLKREGKNWSK